MTSEEKRAVQTVLIDEIQARLQEQPTLLIDALLSGNGHTLVHHILSQRLAQASNASRMLTQLLKAIQTDGQPAGGDEAAA